MDIFGYAIPTSLNANNKHEARERILGSSIYFAIAFLSPFVTMPLFNKFLLKKAGITEKFGEKGVEIVRLSKEHLIENAQKMKNGLDELIFDLKENPNTSKKTKEKFKNVDKDFQKILDRFPDKEVLRTKLLKTHTKIAIADYIITGAMLIATCFGVRELTKKLSGRTGFSAEYKMADEEYTKKNTEKHEKNKLKKIIGSIAIMLAGSIGINKFIEKSFLKEAPKGLMKAIKNNAKNFNYTDGKFMKILPYALITLVGDTPAFLSSSRDKYELRDSSVRLAMCYLIFFGGDAVLNRIAGGLLDKMFNTKIVNKEGLNEKSSMWKKMTAPIYSLQDLNKKTDWDTKLIKRTKRAGVGMYWLNLALITLILGTAIPKALNFVLRKSVNKDLNKNPQNDYPNNVSENSKETFKKFSDKK
ncbi:MAG: hypothetical protein WCY19_06995 [Candidatus Gastranaerophilaceae bacterium]